MLLTHVDLVSIRTSPASIVATALQQCAQSIVDTYFPTCTLLHPRLTLGSDALQPSALMKHDVHIPDSTSILMYLARLRCLFCVLVKCTHQGCCSPRMLLCFLGSKALLESQTAKERQEAGLRSQVSSCSSLQVCKLEQDSSDWRSLLSIAMMIRHALRVTHLGRRLQWSHAWQFKYEEIHNIQKLARVTKCVLVQCMCVFQFKHLRLRCILFL